MNEKGGHTSKMLQALPDICKAYVEDDGEEGAARLVGTAAD